MPGFSFSDRDCISLIDSAGFRLVDFSNISPVECPCGLARRALYDEPGVPYSLHITEITEEAQVHYHRRTTETYLILECEQKTCLELNGQMVGVQTNTAVVIYPGTRHRAVGKIKVAIIATPKFDPLDEWLD